MARFDNASDLCHAPRTVPAASSKGDETRARLLAIAQQVIKMEGIDALTIRTISERAGLSVSVVSHHFGGKQGLLDACKNAYYEGLGGIVRAVFVESSGAPMADLIELAIRDTFSYSRVHRAVLRMLTRDVFADGGLIKPYRTHGQRPHFNPMIDGLAPQMGLDETTARVRLQAISVVLTRFAVGTAAELEAIFGLTGDAAVAAAEDHLVDMAKLLLLSR